MTVNQLIDYLSQCHPNAIVVLTEEDANSIPDGECVILETAFRQIEAESAAA